MKRILLLLCGVLSVMMVKAQDLGVTYRNEVFQFKEDVCKLTISINYWDREIWTYWYDTNGNVVRYFAQKFKGDKQHVSNEMVTLTPEGKFLTSSYVTFNNGVQTDIKRDTCKEYNGGAVIEIPRPKLEYVYYQVPGKKDKRGNWLQVSRSYGKYNEIISREIAYHSSMPNAVKAEFDDIASINNSVKKYYEHKAELEAQKRAEEEKYQRAFGFALIFLITLFVLFLLTIKDMRRNSSKSYLLMMLFELLFGLLWLPLGMALDNTSRVLLVVGVALALISFVTMIWWLKKGLKGVFWGIEYNGFIVFCRLCVYMMLMLFLPGLI